MKVIDLEQGSPEWLSWRQTGVTASDVAAVLGVSSYKTKWQLWAEKTGLRPPDDLSRNPAVMRGRNYEGILRRRVSVDRKIGLMPICIEHDDMAILKASLDGIDSQRRPWEFKIPMPSNYKDVRDNLRESSHYIRYLPQIHQQMLCAGVSEGFMVFGDIDDISDPPRVRDYIIIPVQADLALQDRIKEAVTQFHDDVVQNREPKKDPQRDVFVPSAGDEIKAWNLASSQMIPLLDRKIRLEDELKLVKAELDALGDLYAPLLGEFKRGEFGPVSVNRVTRKGNVDWDAYAKSKGDIPDDDGVFDPYRKSESTHFQFKLRG